MPLVPQGPGDYPLYRIPIDPDEPPVKITVHVEKKAKPKTIREVHTLAQAVSKEFADAPGTKKLKPRKITRLPRAKVAKERNKKCSWCGRPVPAPAEIHIECAEARDRVRASRKAEA